MNYKEDSTEKLFRMQITINSVLQTTIQSQAKRITYLEETISGLVTDFNKFEDLMDEHFSPDDKEAPKDLGIPDITSTNNNRTKGLF